MKKIIAFLALAALVAGGWIVLSPYWTLHRLREAVVARDAAKVSSFVDFPVLREDLKSDLTVAMMAKAGDGGDAMNAVGMGLGMMMVGGMVEQFVSPAGVQMLLAGDGRAEVPDLQNADDFEIVRDGISTFRVRSISEPDKASVVFTRHGLGWVVTGVEFPPEAFAGQS